MRVQASRHRGGSAQEAKSRRRSCQDVFGGSNITVTNVGQAPYATAAGDSGGIVYSGSRALGVHSGFCNGTLSVWSWIDTIEPSIAVKTLTFDPS